MPDPQILHFTLFFDAAGATPDLNGLFSFSSVQLGTQAVTNFPSDTGQFFWPGLEDLRAAPVGTKVLFSFLDKSGDVAGALHPPAGWVKVIMGAPFTPALPTFNNPQTLTLTFLGDDGAPPLLLSVSDDGFALNQAGVTWSIKVVARVFVQSTGETRIFRTRQSLIILQPPPPGLAADIFDTDVDNSGG